MLFGEATPIGVARPLARPLDTDGTQGGASTAAEDPRPWPGLLPAVGDRFGFWFWLGWIVWFAASFILASVIWTVFLRQCFGQIQGEELTITWSVAVFGSWLLLVIPFMRKKEQVWKRLNTDQEEAARAWHLGLLYFIGLLILCLVFWNFFYRDRIQRNEVPGLDPLWTRAVLSSWLVLLVPFLLIMYRKADRIFRTAAERQTGKLRRPAAPAPLRWDCKAAGKLEVSLPAALRVPKDHRLLAEKIRHKIKSIPPTLPRGHVLTVVLADGRRIPNVFVLDASEILGVYDQTDLGFEAKDVADVEPVDASRLPAYQEARWLRLDR